MRAGWQSKTIDAVCEVVNGGTPKTGVPEYWDGPHQWITPAEMGKRATPYIDQTERTITDTGLQNSSARLLPAQSVILSSRAPIGHLVINTVPMATNQGCKGLVPRERLDCKYLYYYLASIVPLLNDLGTGATFKELSGGKLKEVPIPLPPLPEQHHIVAILDAAFDGIATAKANAEQNLQNARALFESHLQAVFTGREVGWASKPLGSFCELISGQHIDAKDYNANGRGVGYLTGPSDFGPLNPVITKWSEHPKRMARAGDILVTVKGSGVGKINLLDTKEVAISRQLMAVRAVAADVSYLYAFLSTKFDYFQSLASGAAIPGISREDVLDLVCPMPPPEEQQAIVELVHAVSFETQRLESLYRQKLAALEELKKSLLHQAFSGQL